MASRIIIRNTQAPGDILVLSAAIRDLHRTHPGMFETDISVSHGAEHIYWHNSDITQIHKGRPPHGIRHFVAHYPLIKQSNQQRKHFIWGFPEFMNQKLGTKIKLTEFRPKIVMTQEEVENRPFEEPYWLFLSGGKRDFPAKIWDQTWWQELISATCNDIKWVQCGGGSKNHILHTPKRGIFANKIAQTNCREFIKLIYHAEGVVCAVTFAMHVAAAFNKPCVVIAGGREPWWWEAYNKENRIANMRVAYPGWTPPADDSYVYHRFLHTIGKLDCCRNHGCWRAKVTGRGSVCSNVVAQHGQRIPKCLAMIPPERVIEAIYSYSNEVRELPKVTPIEVVRTSWKVFARGGDRWAATLPVVQQQLIRVDNRVDALRRARSDTEWVVWVEEGSVLQADWEYQLRQRVRKPGIFGRLNCTKAGLHYPYPGGFVAHTSLLKDGETFEQLFDQRAEQYGEIGDIMKLSTQPVGVA